MAGFLAGLAPASSSYMSNGAFMPMNSPMTGPGPSDYWMPAGATLGGIKMDGAGSNGFLGVQGLGANLDTAKLGLGGLQALGSLWSASQQNKLAKKAFNFQSGILNTNIANQIKDYNLGIDDKFRSRAVVEGTSNADRDAAIAKWQATDERNKR
jgi:hypothetical protein